MKPVTYALSPLLVAVLAVATARAGTTTAGVQGTVTDVVSKSPLAGAQIDLVLQDMGTKMSIKTDARGKFSQVGFRPGTWDMTVRKEGYQEWSGPVQLSLGNRVPIEVTLAPARAAEAAPAPGAGGFSLGDVKVSKEAGEAFIEAQEALAAEDKAKARGALTRFLALETSIAGPYFVLAQIEREEGDAKKAIELLKTGLALKPDETAGWLALGEIQAEGGDSDGSLASFRKAAEVAPADPRPLKKLAMALVIQQDYAGAATAIEDYLKLAPDAPDAAEKKTLLEEVRKLGAKKK